MTSIWRDVHKTRFLHISSSKTRRLVIFQASVILKKTVCHPFKRLHLLSWEHSASPSPNWLQGRRRRQLSPYPHCFPLESQRPRVPDSIHSVLSGNFHLESTRQLHLPQTCGTIKAKQARKERIGTGLLTEPSRTCWGGSSEPLGELRQSRPSPCRAATCLPQSWRDF